MNSRADPLAPCAPSEQLSAPQQGEAPCVDLHGFPEAETAKVCFEGPLDCRTCGRDRDSGDDDDDDGNNDSGDGDGDDAGAADGAGAGDDEEDEGEDENEG